MQDPEGRPSKHLVEIVVTHYQRKPWWWMGSSPKDLRKQVIGNSLIALVGLAQIALHRLKMSEPLVWVGGIQLLLGCWLVASALLTLRAIDQGDTVDE